MEAKAYINKGTEGHYEVIEIVLVYPNYYIHSISHKKADIVEMSSIKTIKRTPERPNLAIHENLQPIELQEGEELFVENAGNPMMLAYEGRPNGLNMCMCCKGVIKNSDFFKPNTRGIPSNGICKDCNSKGYTYFDPSEGPFHTSQEAIMLDISGLPKDWACAKYCAVCYHAEKLNENNLCSECSNLPY